MLRFASQPLLLFARIYKSLFTYFVFDKWGFNYMELWISISWLVRSAKFRLSVGKEKQYCYIENWKIKKNKR